MRLALLAPITSSVPPLYDGLRERQIALLCAGLVRQGIDVTLFASGDSQTPGQLAAVCPVACATESVPASQDWTQRHVAHLSARAGEFDLIHNYGDLFPLAYSQPLPTPILTTLYSGSMPQMCAWQQGSLERQYYVAQWEVDRHPDAPAVAIIPPAVDLDMLTYQPAVGTYLLVYGSLHAQSGIATALAIAQQGDKPLILAGPVQDVAYFQAEVEPYLDPERVRYVGPVATAAYQTLLGGAYALLQTGRVSAEQRLSAVEALACGTPVVTVTGEAMAEMIQHGHTGYLAHDAAGAVAALAQVAGLRRQDCRAWAVTHCAVDRMVDAYINVYITILEQEKARAHHAAPPWGRWEVLLDTPTYKVKRLTVWPGARLSYQRHAHRAEHWTVVQGEALVTLDDVDTRYVAGQAIDIPRASWHRLANPGEAALAVIEVQCGDYLGEDDIERREDDHGRGKTAVHVDGAVQQGHTFDFVGLASLAPQIGDVGTCVPGREGSAVRLRTILEAAGVHADATHVTFRASRDQFSACVPLAAVIDRALLVYRQGLEPLSTPQGGPVRLLITDAEGCALEDVSACTHVKHLDHIHVTVGQA